MCLFLYKKGKIDITNIIADYFSIIVLGYELFFFYFGFRSVSVSDILGSVHVSCYKKEIEFSGFFTLTGVE